MRRKLHPGRADQAEEEEQRSSLGPYGAHQAGEGFQKVEESLYRQAGSPLAQRQLTMVRYAFSCKTCCLLVFTQQSFFCVYQLETNWYIDTV